MNRNPKMIMIAPSTFDPRHEARDFDIYGLPDAGDGQRNWKIANVDVSKAIPGSVQRGVITVHYQLGQRYHLILDTRSRAPCAAFQSVLLADDSGGEKASMILAG